MTRNNDWTTSANDYPPFDASQPSNNPDYYGRFTSRQAPRVFRADVRVSF